MTREHLRLVEPGEEVGPPQTITPDPADAAPPRDRVHTWAEGILRRLEDTPKLRRVVYLAVAGRALSPSRRAAQLTPSEFHLLTVLALMADSDLSHCYPAVRRMMRESGHATERSLHRVLKGLVTKGWVRRPKMHTTYRGVQFCLPPDAIPLRDDDAWQGWSGPLPALRVGAR